MFNTMTLGTVRQALSPKGIRVCRVEPYPDGRCRFKAWNRDDRTVFADSPEGLHFLAIKRL